MADEILMPKLGNSVESCIIVEWNVKKNDTVSVGDLLCIVETDKATVDVESTKAGTVLDIFYAEGDEVPVYTPIAVVGKPGETVSSSRKPPHAEAASVPEKSPSLKRSPDTEEQQNRITKISPRARNKAEGKNVDLSRLQGSGPGGRILEGDVEKEIAEAPSISPAARASVQKLGGTAPPQGSGIGGRILSSDVSVQGVRKVIAETMLRSLTTTAQYTIHTSADARALLALRRKFKTGDPSLGVENITINDSILFAVSRTLLQFPEMNAHFLKDTIRTFDTVDLGIAVDTPRGLLVPVLRGAETMSLKTLSLKAREIYTKVENSALSPDDLTGSTFTVTNLGSLGVEWFTPVLNIPEVAILGVCSIEQKPVLDGETITLVPHIGLSLTINHQAVDGAPAAAFLHALAEAIKNIDIVTAL